MNKILSIILIIAILSAIGMFAYSVAVTVSEEFTEFYILGLRSKSADYPKTLGVGDEAKIIVGIVNHEGEKESYRLEIRVNGERKRRIESIVLNDKQKWEEIVDFTVDKAGEKQKVEFLLFKQAETEIYHSLHLWIDVE